MQTVTEMEAERRARIELAQRYDALVGQQARLRSTIPQLEAARLNLDPLRKILELAAEVPASVLTRSVSTLGWSVPSLMPVRTVIAMVGSAALSVAERKDAEREAELTKARATLVTVEAELATFA